MCLSGKQCVQAALFTPTPPPCNITGLTAIILQRIGQLRSLGNGKSWGQIINHSFVQDRNESERAGMAIKDERFVPLLKGQ